MNEVLVTAIVKVFQDEPLTDKEFLLYKRFLHKIKKAKIDWGLLELVAGAKKRKEDCWKKIEKELSCQGLLDS